MSVFKNLSQRDRTYLYKVKRDADDSLAAYLEDKLTAGTGISIEEVTESSVKKLSIATNSAVGTDTYKVKVNASNDTDRYLKDAISNTEITAAGTDVINMYHDDVNDRLKFYVDMDLNDINDFNVDTSSLTGQFLWNDGSNWVEKDVYTYHLYDVDTGSQIDGDILLHNGEAWEAVENNFRRLADYDVSSIATDDILSYDSSAGAYTNKYGIDDSSEIYTTAATTLSTNNVLNTTLGEYYTATATGTAGTATQTLNAVDIAASTAMFFETDILELATDTGGATSFESAFKMQAGFTRISSVITQIGDTHYYDTALAVVADYAIDTANMQISIDWRSKILSKVKTWTKTRTLDYTEFD